MSKLLGGIMEISRNAGAAILEVYAEEDFGVSTKDDNSPLTRADMAAHGIIIDSLKRLAPDIPVLSEESDPVDYLQRKQWKRYFLVDPLDGTKEFINRNDEFTVNIALIDQGIPVMGVVFVPVLDLLYAGTLVAEKSAFVERNGNRNSIQCRQLNAHTGKDNPLTIVTSRRHGVESLDVFLERLGPYFTEIKTKSMGSSLKLCLVAEGQADLYPRLAPTSEWDTAAAQAIVEAAGGMVLNDAFQRLRYNTRDSLLNPSFFVLGDPEFPWVKILNESMTSKVEI